MKIYKGKYGWTTLTSSTNRDGVKNNAYMSVSFPMGEEPISDEIEGELIFRRDNGEEKKCFLSNYVKQDGTSQFKLVFKKERTIIEQSTLTGDGRDMLGHIDDNKVELNPEEYPFY